MERRKGGTWIRLLILRILYDSPMHGYALNKKVNSFQAGRRPIKPESLYTILRRMEEEGLLELTGDEASACHPFFSNCECCESARLYD